MKLGVTTLKSEGLGFQQAHLQALIRAGELVPILLSRDSRLEVMPASEEWRSGDRIIYLLHDPRPVLLKRLSGASQATRLSVERLPEVEEIPLTKGQPGKILDVVPTESKPDKVSDKQAKVG